MKEKKGEKSLASIWEKYTEDEDPLSDGDWITTGSVVLDQVFGGLDHPGLPLGKYVEIATPAGWGKTTMALEIVRSLAESGYSSVYLDFESALEKPLLDGMGLTSRVGKELAIHRPQNFLDLEEMIARYIEVPNLRLMVIDSITAVLPSKWAKVEVESYVPGMMSRFQGNFLAKYKGDLAKKKITLLFLNQWRVHFSFGHGRATSSEGGSGSKALEHWTDIRCQGISNSFLRDTDGEVYGSAVKLQSIKNKFTSPMSPGIVYVVFGRGVSNLRSYQDALIGAGFISSGKGGYYTLSSTLTGGNEEKLRGEAGLQLWLKDHINEAKEIIRSQKIKFTGSLTRVAKPEPEDEEG